MFVVSHDEPTNLAIVSQLGTRDHDVVITVISAFGHPKFIDSVIDINLDKEADKNGTDYS